MSSAKSTSKKTKASAPRAHDPLDFGAIFADNNTKNERLEMLDAIGDKVFGVDNLAVKTQFNSREIMAFATARTFAIKYNIPILLSWTDAIMLNKISQGRQSRKEFADIAKSMLAAQTVDDKQKTLADRLFGM
jgi:hypothetical protein